MKTIALIIAYIITNVIVAQSVFVSEEHLVLNDSIQLPGTLKFQAELKQQPLVIYIQGSGDPDRNGNQPAFNVNSDYINQLGNALAEQNIAFYSFDKRNVTKTNLKFLKQKYLFSDLATDVTKVIDAFKDDNRFSSITLIGHSQGSLVAMLALNSHVDKFVSLAGLSDTVDKAFVRQITNQSNELGDVAKQHIEELKTTGDIKEINPYLVSLFAKANHEFLIDYFKYNPSEEIKKINLPILILNGTKDIQVPIDDAKILHEANPKSKLVLIEDMNHVLKTIEKDEDNLKSYYTPDYPLSLELITLITEFVKE